MGRTIDKTAQSENALSGSSASRTKRLSRQNTIKESIEDETMAPIKHMTAPSAITVRAERVGLRQTLSLRAPGGDPRVRLE
jgi:hypothetical protein